VHSSGLQQSTPDNKYLRVSLLFCCNALAQSHFTRAKFFRPTEGSVPNHYIVLTGDEHDAIISARLDEFLTWNTRKYKIIANSIDISAVFIQSLCKYPRDFLFSAAD
jgi:hypothetical protein